MKDGNNEEDQILEEGAPEEDQVEDQTAGFAERRGVPDDGDIPEEMPEVEQELSKVAANPKQSLIILAAICGIFLYLFYTFFISSGEEEVPVDITPTPTGVQRPTSLSGDDDIPSIPTLPSPPQLEDPSLPPPPPLETASSTEATPLEAALPDSPPLPIGAEDLLPPPGEIEPTLPTITTSSNEEKKKRDKQKRTAPIVLIAGKVPAKTPEEVQQEADFKYRGNMNLVLGRGKMIDAVVESAINTDFGGEVRAVIVRDIYSEWGKNILIPKGSKIFGEYNTGIEGAYGRVAITWTRVDLINGYTINFAGTASDGLGRKGVQGRVDNKWRERFTNAVMRTAFNIALANVLDSIVEPTITSQAAATNNTLATTVRAIANGATATTDAEARAERLRVCAEVLAVITDTTSTAYTTISTTCNELQTQTGSSEQEKLTSLKNTINGAADSLIISTNETVESTKAQEAAEQGFTDISDAIKEIVEEQEFKPTITIDQGTRIKIYVNRDFRFPKAAVGRTRVMQ